MKNSGFGPKPPIGTPFAGKVDMLKVVLPTRAIALLMLIGFGDLLATAILHWKGLIVELNPLMRPLIVRSEFLFAFVKGASLVAAWICMAIYAREHRSFVRNACLVGAAVYVLLWIGWFLRAA